jgi:excisionase family DNA binding protein
MNAAVKPLYMTRKQAAATLSCSDQTISKLHKAGRLPFYYLGRNAVRIRFDDLEAMLSCATGTSRRAL